MCRVLAYVGEEIPLEQLLLAPENSLINQSLDPELHPRLQLAGWGFGLWSEHLLKPDAPLVYHRPKAAFYDDNAEGLIPSLRASAMLAHVRASGYDASVVQADENCHPFHFEGAPWLIAHNGGLPNWRRLQRELLPLCEDRWLTQMRGTTDTEFLAVLLLSLLDGDSDADLQRAFEALLHHLRKAMQTLDLAALTKLKIAMVAPNRLFGVNYGCDRNGNTRIEGDWQALRPSAEGEGDLSLSMLLEPMYLLTGRNFQDHAGNYKVDADEGQGPTSAIFASEPLTEDRSEWTELAFGECVALHKKDGIISSTISRLEM